MLYDRPYMQTPPLRNDVQAIRWIIIANAAVFLVAQIPINFGSTFLHEIFHLSWSNIRSGLIWCIATYSLIHADFFHILATSLLVFFFGRPLQTQIGGNRLLEIYVTSVLFGALFWLPVNLTSQGSVVGSSAGALGIATVFCLSNFNQRINLLLFFIMPVTITGKQMIAFFFGFDLIGFLFFEMGPLQSVSPLFSKGIAYSAHLGGMIGGYLFYRYRIDRKSLLRRRSPLIEIPLWVKKKAKKSPSKPNFRINILNRKQLKTEVDRILDKINTSGFGSLSEEEKQILDRAKDTLNH
ncbi:MAG: hypothetical protein DF168_01126 [Candidatus Moanabacter tarae]|uniref:Uncharacterized protein n=1 Tax=Candidatus Moanibacter tarae TaxID=2200854 RepID=A0A2Z4AFY4_9BACT|nr:MAG: hypothetical protein DF168_01126 [Candidatus Moanabacter tarae]